MKKIAFFLSAQDIDRKYADPALELVRLVVKEGYTFVYGGSHYGLMKEASDVAKKLGGTVIGVSSEEFRHVLREDLDETHVGRDVPERRQLFLKNADAVVALPGGTGTLDEITDVLAARKMGFHNKPIAFLNTDNFWSGLIEQLRRMERDGFLPAKVDDLLFVSEDPHAIMKYLNDGLS